jgi:hypothetical protein
LADEIVGRFGPVRKVSIGRLLVVEAGAFATTSRERSPTNLAKNSPSDRPHLPCGWESPPARGLAKEDRREPNRNLLREVLGILRRKTTTHRKRSQILDGSFPIEVFPPNRLRTWLGSFSIDRQHVETPRPSLAEASSRRRAARARDVLAGRGGARMADPIARLA